LTLNLAPNLTRNLALAIMLILDNVMGRLIELKHEMVNHDMKVFQFHDDIFADLKITPADFLLQIPNYVTLERKQNIEDRTAKLDMLITKLKMTEYEYNPK